MSNDQIVCRDKVRALEKNILLLAGQVAGCEEMKKNFSDHLEFMKLNVDALQGLLARCQTGPSFPTKSRNHNLTSLCLAKMGIDGSHLNSPMVELKQEIDQLKAQLDVYKNDFAVERIARQALEMEKEQLVAELQQLKLHNRNLIDKASNGPAGQQIRSRRRRLISHENDIWNSELHHSEMQAMHCSHCNRVYGDIHSLETHIDDCPAY
ncbi:NF-kappa-B essential modulator-like [Toxorhynchites rutilus septentrionalis]|uniref:NF-kappa-B essential modulator-like n=1 Tax=Toxorhynchites rutilus septentrionalis TaxID=329112 RepID=UPI0024797B12|nr:NF-kappa-B essential modulator-like [Toxorhynchites rutilus septentrionalis]